MGGRTCAGYRVRQGVQSVYLEHYRLVKEPFHIAATPGVFYTGETHREALAMLLYGVRKRLGIIALLGDVGTGKTTVLRAFLERVHHSDIRTILMFNPNVTFTGLLLHILGGLGVDAAGRDERWMMHALAIALQREHQEGRTVALLIDEAHHMPPQTMEKIHLISNLESGRGKMLQIVLLAQPELDDLLAEPRLRQIRQRIAVRHFLRPLKPWECLDYLRFRIRMAGGEPEQVFTRRALRAIARSARGVPRLLNVFADNALITGMGHGLRRVPPGVVREVIRDFTPRRRVRVWRLAAAAVLAAVSGTALATAAIAPRAFPPAAAPREASEKRSDAQVPPSSASAPVHVARVSAALTSESAEREP